MKREKKSLKPTSNSEYPEYSFKFTHDYPITGSSLLVHATYPSCTKCSGSPQDGSGAELTYAERQGDKPRSTSRCGWGENQILPPILEVVCQSSLLYIAFQC